MKPSDQLKAEHEAILVMLAVLEKICEKLERREEVPESHLPGIMEFFQVFADKCHHAKEEEFLFPAYQSVGIPKDGGPIGRMLVEHQEGRAAIAGMKAGLEVLKKEGPQKFISHARDYINLLSAHIQKENNILFPMGDSVLPEARQAAILRDFDSLEETRIGAGKHEEFHRLIEALEAAYLTKSRQFSNSPKSNY